MKIKRKEKEEIGINRITAFNFNKFIVAVVCMQLYQTPVVFLYNRVFLLL